MKAKGCLPLITVSGIILFQITVLITALLLTGCYTDKKSSSSTVEMVVVFNKDVPIAKASSILFEKEYIFHEDGKNSKRKSLSNETGPVYIVKVPKDRIAAFNIEMENIPQIYEIFQSDYVITKD